MRYLRQAATSAATVLTLAATLAGAEAQTPLAIEKDPPIATQPVAPAPVLVPQASGVPMPTQPPVVPKPVAVPPGPGPVAVPEPVKPGPVFTPAVPQTQGSSAPTPRPPAVPEASKAPEATPSAVPTPAAPSTVPETAPPTGPSSGTAAPGTPAAESAAPAVPATDAVPPAAPPATVAPTVPPAATAPAAPAAPPAAAPAIPADPSASAPTPPPAAAAPAPTPGQAPATEAPSPAPAPGPATEAPTPAPTYAVEEVTVAARPVLFVTGVTTWEKSEDEMSRVFAVLAKAAGKLGITEPAGPLVEYIESDSDDVGYRVMLPVATPPKGKLPKGVKLGTSPAGKALKFRHDGPIDDLEEVYGRIDDEVAKRGIDARAIVEEYDADALSSPEDRVVVDVYVFLK